MSDFKKHREKLKLTLEDVAKKTGISTSTLSRLENNQLKRPSFYTVSKLNLLYGSDSKLCVSRN